MHLHSFRLKIGLLCVLLSGLLLTGFLLFACLLLYRAGVQRIDHELRALADAQIRRPHQPDHWPLFAYSLPSIYGGETARALQLQVNHLDGTPIYTATNQPANWPRHALPLSLADAPQRLLEGPPPAQRPPPLRPRKLPPADPQLRPMPIYGPVFATIAVPNALSWRAMTIANNSVQLSLAISLQGLQEEIAGFRHAFYLAAPIVLLLLVGGGWLISHVALRPVNVIAQTMAAITARKLDQRIPDTRADAEFLQLIHLINHMLQRLETSFRQAGRFSADAAHELKTPLAILQARMEQGLQHAPDHSPAQNDYALQLEEVQRIHSILRKLLLLSQADAGTVPLSPSLVNLTDLLCNMLEDLHMLAHNRPATLHADADYFVMADPDLLNQLLQNLASNAIKFGTPGSSIVLALRKQKSQLVFTITNSAPPIPPAEQPLIFDRFFRCDKSRTRTIDGSGLGLSLAREIARAHHGDLSLLRSTDAETTFQLTLPAEYA